MPNFIGQELSIKRSRAFVVLCCTEPDCASELVCVDCCEGVISINRLGLITPLLSTNRLIKCFTSSERPLASVSADDASTQPQQAPAFALTHSYGLVNSLRVLPGNDKLRQVWEY